MLLIFIVQILFVPTASAYEGIFHYAWTYYLALQVGFTERQAYQIASAANAIDWDDQTNPVASPIDTKIDTVFGAERFRYFDKVLNSRWAALDDKLKADKKLYEIDQDTTLLKLRRGLEVKEHNPINMLDSAWKEYYDTLVKSNPAVRTWVQLHAFQPIVLQKHKNGNADVSVDFTSNELDLIALNSPLTSVSQNDQGWLFTNSSLTWGLGRGLTKPAPERNRDFSKNDAYTFDLFNETINLCGKESIRTCLCENINTAVKGLIEAEKSLALLQSKYWELQDNKNWTLNDKDSLDCKINIPISVIQTLVVKVSKHEKFITEIPISEIRETRRGVPSSIQKLMSKAKIYELLNTSFLSNIRKYQKSTEMSWPLIYSALIQDIQTYVLNEYWEPTSPIKLGISHAPTKAVNAVRGKVVSQLKELAEHDLNPGPLLHYIQDIHSHGPYNTYNGHALANHVPDFITQEVTFNAVNATIDTIIVLCEFKDVLSKKSNSKKVQSSKFFVGQRVADSELCTLAAADKELSKAGKLTYGSSELRKYISSFPLFPGKTLESILVELGKQSNAPTIEHSMLTWQGLQKLQGSPPHDIDGKASETTAWTNERLGLPDFPQAVQYLSGQVNPTLIPIWTNNDLRVEGRAMTHPSTDKPYNNIKIGDWKWAPSNIPTSVIQYDYDYCGRVINGDMNWPASDKANEYVGDAKPCNQILAGSGVSKTDIIKEATNALYQVEDISVDIKKISIELVSNGAILSANLEYGISGVIPGLDGGIDLKITKPKNISIQNVSFPGRSTDMFTTRSQINHGPDHLPILEFCQLLVANTDELKNQLRWILKGNHSDSDKEKAADSLYEYMFGDHGHNPEGLSNFTILLNARRYKTKDFKSDTLKKSHFTTANDIPIQQYINNGGEAYMACSVQVQGLPPVVALQKAGLSLKANFGELKRGDSP